MTVREIYTRTNPHFWRNVVATILVCLVVVALFFVVPAVLTGPQGPTGQMGAPGTKGIDGKNGVDGASAYDIAVANGFDGTEQEWLDSLVGVPSSTGQDNPVIVDETDIDTVVDETEPSIVGYDYKGLPACDNPDESTPVQNAVLQEDGLWKINIHKNGCNLIFEGRIIPGERLHRVIVLRSANGENTEFVTNGIFTYAEGSIWQKPRIKNIEDVNNINDPAEALKLLNDKRAVMDANGYDWPIWLYFIDGNSIKFGPGETWEGLTVQNYCNLSEPVQINVHGEKITGKNQFFAAIGATDCVTVAWIDGSLTPTQWVGQRDAGNKVTYVTIEAWLMPSIWSQDQIDAWIAKH